MRRLVQRCVNVKRLWRERSYPTQNQSKAVSWGSETGQWWGKRPKSISNENNESRGGKKSTWGNELDLKSSLFEAVINT